jgi:hypothetical protein
MGLSRAFSHFRRFPAGPSPGLYMKAWGVSRPGLGIGFGAAHPPGG